MGKVRGFLEIQRVDIKKRPVSERLNDWQEFELPIPDPELKDQAARCMDCGIPFCHDGCPLGNLIPDWNDHMYRERLPEAIASLHATNNFPEVTGRVCPAPCEAACVLNIEGTPVTIKNVERGVADRAFERGLVAPVVPKHRTGKKVAVIGSGPAGLAAAQQLARKGHDVTVFERDDRIGGLLRYGIPDFKMEKHLIDRRMEQMQAEGVTFRTGVHCGVDITGDALREMYEAVVLCGGARRPRDLPVPGRELKGVHFAMEFLEQQNKRVAGDVIPDSEAILATGKRVVVIGGGDTGSDCLGTSHRHRAAHVTQLELLPRPPEQRSVTNPWPAWPLVLRSSSSHEEGGERDWSVSTTAFLGDERGHVRALKATRVSLEGGKFVPVPGSEFEIPCELVLLAMGFVGSEREGLLEQLGVAMDARGNVKAQGGCTNVEGVFAAGDMSRGQSLVVWAIAEGRRAAEAVDVYLMQPAKRRLAIAVG
ncbi:dihydropyrimidine dehydrogenase subunit A [Sorangium cellulosum]|uniref:Dihydropyrimidine dehydrogenase subunit A n=1 Tax=Sorangium cellulosum TaxID=56 RepID=A0A2L0EZX5_SORCE|nr:glutamate synthase subunit beta [Sorangium cellulosum]AUX44789.1 dihydropyrimidine dehydrogenase subunit A [Sorangium cellulosum]